VHPASKIISNGSTHGMIAMVLRDWNAIARCVCPLGPIVGRVMDADDWSCHLEEIDEFRSSMLLSSLRGFCEVCSWHLPD
jgi:hypothetical protein